MKKALIAMSGGVDSSVAAYLTKEAGYECIGCTMKLFDNGDAAVSDSGKACCTLEDAEDARAVAFRLGMPHYMFNYKDEFRRCVIGQFVESYRHGETPNPCVECNRILKFQALMERAKVLGCEKLVTGHYARVVQTENGWQLRKGVDPAKDQSYFLHMLTQEQLAHILFPLGELSKPEARAIAEAQGFRNAKKHDSQDICFVPDGDYARVIAQHAGELPPRGEYVDTAGNVLGTHEGIIHYTIGQRRGLGIALGRVQYVVGIDAAHDRVVIGDSADLFTDTAYLSGVNWIPGKVPEEPVRCSAKIRSRHKEQPALLTFTDETHAVLKYDEPQRAITPGQYAVFYDGDNVLGGGRIASACNFAKPVFGIIVSALLAVWSPRRHFHVPSMQ